MKTNNMGKCRNISGKQILKWHTACFKLNGLSMHRDKVKYTKRVIVVLSWGWDYRWTLCIVCIFWVFYNEYKLFSRIILFSYVIQLQASIGWNSFSQEMCPYSVLGFVLGAGQTEMSCVWFLLLGAHGCGAHTKIQEGSTKKAIWIWRQNH